MPLETTPWSILDHIKTEERQLGYLEAVFEDGDPGLIAAALGDIARARGMTDLAEATGISHEQLANALSADGDPRLSTLLGVVKALGLRPNVSTAPT